MPAVQQRVGGLWAVETAAGARPGRAGGVLPAPVAVQRLRRDACVGAGDRGVSPVNESGWF